MTESASLLQVQQQEDMIGTCIICLQPDAPLIPISCANCKSGSARWHLVCGGAYASDRVFADQYLSADAPVGTILSTNIRCPTCLTNNLQVTTKYLGTARQPLVSIYRMLRWARSVVTYAFVNLVSILMMFPVTCLSTFFIRDISQTFSGKLQLLAVLVSEMYSLGHLLARGESFHDLLQRHGVTALFPVRLALAIVCLILWMVLPERSRYITLMIVSTVGSALFYSSLWMISDWLGETPKPCIAIVL